MKRLILNSEKIKKELKRRGETQTWLAKQLGTTRQNVFYMLENRSLRAADKIGNILDIEPKDLLL